MSKEESKISRGKQYCFISPQYIHEPIIGCRAMSNDWDHLYHLNLQSLQQQRDHYSMSHAWKSYNNLMPNRNEVLCSMKVLDWHNGHLSPYNDRSQRLNASLLKASFRVRGCQLWNTLPKNIRVFISLDRSLEQWHCKQGG